MSEHMRTKSPWYRPVIPKVHYSDKN